MNFIVAGGGLVVSEANTTAVDSNERLSKDANHFMEAMQVITKKCQAQIHHLHLVNDKSCTCWLPGDCRSPCFGIIKRKCGRSNFPSYNEYYIKGIRW
jgi:hypothetical protein